MGKKITIGIIGYGTVGKGTVSVILDNDAMIREKTGIDFTIKSVASLDMESLHDLYLERIPVRTTDANVVLDDPDIDIVIELIGGYSPAKEFILKAIKNGKHVVTANKALLAVYGSEIFRAAEEAGVEVAFEGAVGGGIPIIRVMKEDLAGNDIYEMYGIINGTANYILSKMTDEDKEFAEVLGEAQRLGYAESDPTFDVEGIDSAHKIAIMSSIAFRTTVPFEKIFVEGISSIKQVDIEFANQLDCTIKLLAIAKKHEDDIEVRVHPTIIPNRYLLSKVTDVFNAVYLRGDQVGHTVHYGRGAGGKPTGSAVVGDVIAIGRDVSAGCKRRTPILGFQNDYSNKYPVRDIRDIDSAFYLRFTAMDKPGSLSTIAGILAKFGISIYSAIQRSDETSSENVPLVFMTHQCSSRELMNAIEEIDALDVVREKTVVIRVEGLN